MPWNPEQGWAEEGQQWLLLLKVQARVSFSPPQPQFVVQIDVPRSFTYQDEDGKEFPALMPKTIITTEAIQRRQVSWT